MINLNDTPPKRLSQGFTHVVNTLAVETADGWEYYPIKVNRNPAGRYLLIEQAPTVLADGVLALPGKRYFKVSMQDIVRRRIDVNNECDKPGSSPKRKPAESTDTDGDFLSDLSGDSGKDESRTSQTNWARECEDANLAFEQQVAALQGSAYPETGSWEVPDDL